MRVIADPDLEEVWIAGKLPAWAAAVVVAAAVASFAAVLFGPHLIWQYISASPNHVEPPLHHLGVALAFAIVVITGFLSGSGDRVLRLAVVLPIAHVASLFALWALWAERPSEDTYKAVRWLTHAPIAPTLAAIAGFVVLVAVAIARGRERLHAATMVALSILLATGLWLPVAARVWWGYRLVYGGSLLWMIGPPIVVGTAFAAFNFHWPSALERWRAVAITTLCVLAVGAFGGYAGWTASAAQMFNYYLYVPFAMVVVAGGSLAALALARWLEVAAARRALARDAITGIVADDGVAARVEIASWLRGPRTIVRAFAVTTRDGEVVVPGGHLVAALSPATTRIACGDSRAVLATGDRVVLAGFRRPAADAISDDGPFRASAAPVAHGRVVIALADEPPSASLALALWRPSVAYLIVVVSTLVPGLIGAALAS